METLTQTPEQTRDLAANFARQLPPHAIVGLSGTLGAGKTVFVQGMAVGLGIDPEGYVTSPTFALIHEYGKLIHFDLYRLNSFAELLDIGLEDYAAQEGILVLEWANRFPELVKQLTHRIEIEIVKEETRRITIS